MEIIDELEPVRRGIYGGATGYLSYGGEMDVAIAIRTGIIKDGMLYVQAAAGIVADSDPEKEWLETEAKARSEEHTSELQSLMRNSYAVFCLKKKKYSSKKKPHHQ